MIINTKKNKLLKEIDNYIKEYDKKNLYTLFESEYGRNIIKKSKKYENIEYLYDLFKTWDEEINLPKELGKEFEKLITDEDLTIGVHRTCIYPDIFSDVKTKSMLTDGIRNYGDLSSGSVRKYPDVSKTVSMIDNILNMLIMLKSSYKNSTGSFLLAFPKRFLNNEGDVNENNRDKIYNLIDDVSYIKPEYILGYVDNSYGVMNFLSREQILEHIKENSIDITR